MCRALLELINVMTEESNRYVEPEASSQHWLALISEYEAIESQQVDKSGMYFEFEEGRFEELQHQLTTDCQSILLATREAADADRAKIASVLGRVVDWPQQAATIRLDQFREYVEAIPAEAFTDEIALANLQISNRRKVPLNLQEKSVEALELKSEDDMKQFIYELNQFIPEKYVVRLLGKLSVEERRQALASGQFEPLSLNHKLKLLDNFPIEEQKPYIDQAMQEQNGYYADVNQKRICRLLKDWPMSESRPYVNQFLKNTRRLFKWTYPIATAVANWDLDLVSAEILNVDDFNHSDVTAREGNAIFAISVLANRDLLDTSDVTTSVWISQAINTLSRKQVGLLRTGQTELAAELHQLFNRFPDLIDIYLEEVTQKDSDLSDELMTKVLARPVEDQYQHITSVARHYMRNLSEANSEVATTVSEWDPEHHQALLNELLSLSEKAKYTNAYSQYRAAALSLLYTLPYDKTLFSQTLLQEAFSFLYNPYNHLFDLVPFKLTDVLKKYYQDEPQQFNQAIALWSLTNPGIVRDIQDFESPFELVNRPPYRNVESLQADLTEELKPLTQLKTFESLDKLYDFFQENQQLLDFYINVGGQIRLQAEHIQLIDDGQLPFSYIEAELLLRGGVDITQLGKKNSEYKKAWQILRKSEHYWPDQDTITYDMFETGAETFGYRRMFQYVHTDRVTPHDAVHAMQAIVDMQAASGLKPKEFFGNILFQVARDTADYDGQTAYHRFNTIASSMTLTVTEQLTQAQAMARANPQILQLQAFLDGFQDQAEVFASWNNLRIYADRIRILEEKRFLDQLAQLHQQGKHALANYVEVLMFHPDSKVSAQAIEQFLFNPRAFFESKASHTPDDVHDRKKPSNYVDIPNLDLTAEALRDALVEGHLDTIQAFNPLRIEYRVPLLDGNYVTDLRQMLKTLVPESRNDDEAIEVIELRQKLMVMVKSQESSYADFLAGKDSLSLEQLSQIQQAFFESPLADTLEWHTVVMELHAKGDPIAAVAGDDTSSCMPWGDGKTAVYIFNLNTGQVTLRVGVQGALRTVAQSVVTKDRKVDRPVPQILADIERGQTHLPDIVSQQVLDASPRYAAQDNVETRPAWTDDQSKQQLIAAAYQDFWWQYMELFAQEQNLDPTKIPIGMAHSDAFTKLKTEANHYVPQAPVSYSDKTGEEVYILDISQPPITSVQVVEVEVDQRPKEVLGTLPEHKQVSFLTYQDALSVGYIEGKAYQDNPELIQYLHNMENGLIAMQINNAAKRRPHMSLKYQDQHGHMRGYLLAYEGKYDAHQQGNFDEEWKQTGERVLYIADLASDKDSQLAGGRLLTEFVNLYKHNYLDKGDPISIFLEAREKNDSSDRASYEILVRKLNKIASKLGIEFELEELPLLETQNATRHPIMIRAKK